VEGAPPRCAPATLEHITTKEIDMKYLATILLIGAFVGTAYADGAATYAAKCKVCHGAAGEGTKMAPDPIKGHAEADVLKAINDGKGKMKAVKINDAADVAKYVAGLK
jgi:mono/diheme cytochrome c family protein